MSSVELPTLTSSAPNRIFSGWSDSIGIVASIACAIHCAAMPFVIAYLPALGISFLADSAFHKWMALICFVVAFAAFIPGLWRHKNFLPAGIATVGLSLITYAAFGLPDDCCSPNQTASNKNENSALVTTDACDHCDHCTPPASANLADLQCQDSQCQDSQCQDSQCQDSQCQDSQCQDSQCQDSQCQDSQFERTSCEDTNCCEGEPKYLVASNTEQTSGTDSQTARTPVVKSDDNSWLALLLPWITPIGGLALVTAHLFNRQLSCGCSCCVPSSNEEGSHECEASSN